MKFPGIPANKFFSNVRDEWVFLVNKYSKKGNIERLENEINYYRVSNRRNNNPINDDIIYRHEFVSLQKAFYDPETYHPYPTLGAIRPDFLEGWFLDVLPIYSDSKEKGLREFKGDPPIQNQIIHRIDTMPARLGFYTVQLYTGSPQKYGEVTLFTGSKAFLEQVQVVQNELENLTSRLSQ